MKQKAFIYARTSLKTQPIMNQIDQCTNYCKEQGYDIDRIFMDEGYETTEDRPAFNNLIKALEEDKRTVVIVYHIDRLFKRDRDAFQTFQFKYHIKSVL